MKTVSFITLRKLLTFASHVANSQLPYVWRYLHASVPLSTKHSNSTPSKIWRLTRHHCNCNWTSGIDQFFQNLIMVSLVGRDLFDISKMIREQHPWKLLSEFIVDVQQVFARQDNGNSAFIFSNNLQQVWG